MAKSDHSSEQGLRVHYLANLGGLVALAGLGLEPPDFLLGVLLSVAREAIELSPQQRAEIAAMGQVKLDERATGKRAWTAWRRARDVQELALTAEEMRRVITALGGSVPENGEPLAAVLMRTLRKGRTDGQQAKAE